MRLDLGNEKTWYRLAWLAWAIVVVAIAGRLLVNPENNELYKTWANAGQTWLAGDLVFSKYALKPGLDQYRYGPFITVLYVPWSFLPNSIGMMLWRALNLFVLLAGCFAFLKHIVPWTSSRLRTSLFFLLILPLSIGSLNNGQINPLMAGLILLGVAWASEERWWASSLCLALAFWMKPYVIALALLLILVYPRQLSWRFMLLALLGFLIPFACQNPNYVWEQYGEWVRIVRIDDRKDRDLAGCYRDFWLVCRAWHIPMTRTLYLALQGVTALGAACFVFWTVIADWPRRHVLTGVVAWGCTWVMLFGPATESSTYVVLAPSLACAVLDAWINRRSRPVRLLAASSLIVLTGTLISCWFPNGSAAVHSLGLHPLATLLLGFALLATWIEDCVFFSRPNMGCNLPRSAPI